MSSFRLFGSKPPPTPGEKLLKAVEEGDIVEVEALCAVKRGLDVNFVNKDGNSAVHLALIQHCINGPPEAKVYTKIIGILGKHKADFNIENKVGFRPLEIAYVEYTKNRVSIHMLKLLRLYGAKTE